MDRPTDLLSPGPDDPSVLYRQSLHRSSQIWNDGAEVVLIVRNSKQLMRDFTRIPRDARVVDYLVSAGVYGFYRMGCIKLYHPLITALIERWRPETHTFHMPCGECTITLEDISAITGLPVDGLAVTGMDAEHSVEDWILIVQRLLGIAPPASAIHGARIKITWLTRHFTRLPDGADDEVVRQHARATLLLLIGGGLLPDKSGNKLKLMYLPMLEQLEDVGRYSWGSATLACLYREMCKAAQSSTKEISGPLVILQIWAWERFSLLRPLIRHLAPMAAPMDPLPQDAPVEAPAEEVPAPDLPHDADADAHPNPPLLPADPYGYRWHGRLTLTACRTLRDYRDQLDLMTESQMTWQPYPTDLSIPARDRAIWRARVPLICFDVVEMYFPDRVMRQFGLIQEEPVTCETSLSLHAIDRRGRTGIRWDAHHRDYIAAWEDRLNRVVTAAPSIGRMTPDDPYMRWYRTISRTPIGPLRDVPPIGSQPVAAIKTILVDTVVRATQIAVDLLNCTDLEEVRRLAQTLRSIGRRTIATIDEEYHVAEATQATRSSSPPDDRPSPSTRTGPSTFTGAMPSTFAGAGSSSSLGVPPSASAAPPSPVFVPHYPLESIDDYTVVMDDVDTTHSAQLDVTLSVPTTSVAPPPLDTTAPPPPHRHYTRKRARARFDPSMQPLARAQLPHEPLPDTIAPHTQAQVQEGRRNPPRIRRPPTCGTE